MNGENLKMDNTSIAIVGGRNFCDYNILLDTIDQFFPNMLDNYLDYTIVSGGANGADRLAEKFADHKQIKIRIFYANWDRYGKSAGFKRNIEIVNVSDMVIAFWDGKSRGTKNTIDLAINAKKPVIIVPY